MFQGSPKMGVVAVETVLSSCVFRNICIGKLSVIGDPYLRGLSLERKQGVLNEAVILLLVIV